VDRLATRFPFDASPYVVNAGGAWGYGRECHPRDRFEPAATLDFEGMRVPAPGQFQAYLAQVYGDYLRLPPPAERRGRHARTIVDLGSSRGAADGARDGTRDGAANPQPGGADGVPDRMARALDGPPDRASGRAAP
jgi:hypothetical protein